MEYERPESIRSLRAFGCRDGEAIVASGQHYQFVPGTIDVGVSGPSPMNPCPIQAKRASAAVRNAALRSWLPATGGARSPQTRSSSASAAANSAMISHAWSEQPAWRALSCNRLNTRDLNGLPFRVVVLPTFNDHRRRSLRASAHLRQGGSAGRARSFPRILHTKGAAAETSAD
jgi:hypothetical protein